MCEGHQGHVCGERGGDKYFFFGADAHQVLDYINCSGIHVPYDMLSHTQSNPFLGPRLH